jgi:hypothetical protein
MRFSISALTGGTDAQGEVTVRLKENGLVALGEDPTRTSSQPAPWPTSTV